MKTIPLDKSPYSFHFNILKLFGAWVIRSRNSKLSKLFSAYAVFMTMLALFAVYSLLVDLYFVLGDFKKMTWNLCATSLFLGGVTKSLIGSTKCHIINKLRNNLHKDSQSRRSAEDDATNATALRELKLICISFYGSACFCIPLWLSTQYLNSLSGPRELPLPWRIPIDFDLEDNEQYNLVFGVLALGGVAGFGVIVENEIAMLGIMLQISREYYRLLKDIPKINTLLFDCTIRNEIKVFKQEVNPCLRNLKAKELVKEFSSRQQKLIAYTQNFEISYNKGMLVQIFSMTVFAIVCSIQVIIQSEAFSLIFTYQIVFNFVTLLDWFLVCYLATRIRSQCFQVGEEIYSLHWYRMKVDIQKDILMIIMRSQRPPKITSGKLMEVNLHAFMLVLRNIYSWLTLYKQLENKVINN